MNAQLPEIKDNVASMRTMVLESFRFTRGYGNDPVSNKVHVELTIDYERGHMTVTPLPFLVTTNAAQGRYHTPVTLKEEPCFVFQQGTDPEKWGAIVRLIADAMENGRQRLTDLYVERPDLNPALKQAAHP